MRRRFEPDSRCDRRAALNDTTDQLYEANEDPSPTDRRREPMPNLPPANADGEPHKEPRACLTSSVTNWTFREEDRLESTRLASRHSLSLR
jgi:hypothetical protein